MRFLGKNFASVTVGFYSADGKELDGFSTDLIQYDDFGAEQLDVLVQLAAETHRIDFSSNLGRPTTDQGCWLHPA